MSEHDTEKTIFLEAAEIDSAEERRAFLDRACGQDVELRARVEALLAAHECRQPLLDLTQDQPPAEQLGTQIGPYKLLQQIGEGGMGVVYMAEQTEPVERRVALKIIKPGMDSQQVIARFEAERQALAMMDHPQIAKVLYAGATENRRPYFVMELVKGVPITKYCDEQRLTLRARLELFVPVCQAIQHAHQKGIIHRDIKPSNILMALYDGVPVPKVIDFGVAKATGPKLTEKTMFTGFGQLVGTLEYMSPEQAQFNQLDIDTRSDIYSLGVLLYELLTGTTPLEQSRVRTAALDETLRIIREEEPEKPSTRLSSGDTLPAIAANRNVEPARLRKLVRGELDWIVMKALEKDRNRRYETASGLARDVERYLRDEPVQACTPSISYRLSKFIRRNRRRVVMGAVLGLALIVTAGSVAWSLRSSSMRQYRSEAELGAALNEAAVLCGQGDWPKAKARVEQAERLLSAHVGTAKHEHLRVMHNDLDMLARLEELQLQGSPFFSRPESLPDDVDSDAEYAKAFRQYGIDVLKLDPETAAQRLRQSAIHLHLVAGLDDWLWLARSDSRRTSHLRLVANFADPNVVSQRIRNAAGREDQAALFEIASSSQTQALPLSTVLLLYHSMDKSTQERGRAATQILRAAQQRAPGSYVVNVLLARRLIGERPDEAVGFMRVAIAARPQNPRLWYFMGSMLRSAKQFDQAAIAIRHSIALDPRRYVSHHELGLALAADGRWNEAIAAYSESLRVFESADSTAALPLHTNLWKAACLIRCGDCYSHLGQWQNAIGEYSKSIETDSSHVRAWLGRSRSWMMLGEWRRAAQDAARGVQLSPHDVDMRFVQAACLLLANDDEAYREACALALQISAASKDNYPHYITARACILASTGGALSPELLARVEHTASTSGSGGWLHVRAKEHCRSGQYQQALARLDEAMKLDPVWDDRTCLNTLLYALVHLQLGHEAEGRKYLEQFRQRLSRGEKAKGKALTFPAHIANWLSCQILLREVEGLLKQQPAAAEDKSQGQESDSNDR